MMQHTIEWGGSWSIDGEPATADEVESLLNNYFQLDADDKEDDVLSE